MGAPQRCRFPRHARVHLAVGGAGDVVCSGCAGCSPFGVSVGDGTDGVGAICAFHGVSIFLVFIVLVIATDGGGG